MVLRAQWPLGTIAQFFHFVAEEKKKKRRQKNKGILWGYHRYPSNKTREKISYFFTCVDIADQLLTRHSPLAPLGQVDEWTAKSSRFSIQVVCQRFPYRWQTVRFVFPNLTSSAGLISIILFSVYNSFTSNPRTGIREDLLRYFCKEEFLFKLCVSGCYCELILRC